MKSHKTVSGPRARTSANIPKSLLGSDEIIETADYSPDSQKIFFTIVAWNYISYAATLMTSIARVHPMSRRYVIVCDHPANNPNIPLDAEIIYPADIEIPDVRTMEFVYDVMEFSTAIKPYAFLYFHKNYIGAHVLYTDPDLYLVKPLDHVFDALSRGAGLVLTPHMMRPLQDGKQPDDLTIMKSGIYNLGFLGTRAEEETLLFLRWWADRCRRDAIVDIANNKFTDQRWVDLAPAFVGSAYILRHPGYNIAYWNLAGRKITKRRKDYKSNGENIHFLHFSGVVPSNSRVLSKHQDRFEIDDLPVFAELHKIYLADILSNHWQVTSKIPYDFNYFIDRRPIHKFMRASFRRHENKSELTGHEAFASGGGIFDSEEPGLAQDGPPAITRVMYELWMARVDLQRAFAVHDAAGRTQFLNWFVDGGANEAGCDGQSLDAARRMLANKGAIAASIRRAKIEPWQPLASQLFDGTASELEHWLAGPVPIQIVIFGAGVYMPRILALLWEARPDLRQHFQLQDEAGLEVYLTWCITRGVLEGNVPIGLIGAKLGPYLNGTEGAVVTDAAMPPRNRLLRFVLDQYRGPFQHVIDRSPDDIRSQFALALWLCGTARQQYSWPLSMLTGTVRWHQLSSGFICGATFIPNLIYACYRIRGDVQEAFKIETPDGAMRTVAWFIVYGSREFDLKPDLLSKEFHDWLLHPTDAADYAVRNIDYLIWLARPDLQAAFNIDDLSDLQRLRNWVMTEGARDKAVRIWLEALDLLPPKSAGLPVSCAVCLTGLWASNSGRGEDLRLTAAGMRHRGIAFIIFDRRNELFYDADGQEIEVDPAAVRINIVHLNADTALWDYMSLQRAGLTHAYSVGYWAWELERLPEEWNFAYNFYSEVWAASRFAQKAFERGNKRHVAFMPMAVDLPTEKSALKRADVGLADDEFVFYYGFDYRSYMSRKNPEAAIEGFLRAFGAGDKKVRLVLKTLAPDTTSENFRKIAAMAERDPRITILDQEFERADLYALIGTCDCFVSPHRSEGFGRGPAEALLLGVPVIATNYSGNIDFTTPQTALMVDYKLVPLADGEYPGGAGQIWADIDLDELAAAMRRLVDEPTTCLRFAEAGRAFMARNYSINAVSVAYARRVKEIFTKLGL